MEADRSGKRRGERNKLTSIDEDRRRIDEAGRRIAEARRTSATELNLRDLGLTEVPEEIYALGQLRVLNLAQNQIGDHGARAIAVLTGLTSLNLAGNQIGDDGARALGALTCLTSLDLRHNQIGNDGARAIAALISLTSLNLGHNRIGADGAHAIAALNGLTWLILTGNQIGDDGARAIAALTGLASLNLAGNQIGDDGARAVAALTGLASLDLRNNLIGADGARAIVVLTGLTSLYLGTNWIGADGARALLDAWSGRAASQLDRLYLGVNNIGDIGVPAETLDSGDAEAIFAAYRASRLARGQDDVEPQIPAKQQPGYQFAMQTDGRIDLQPSGCAPPDDLAEILAMRGVIIEALDELTPLLVGSNAYGSIAKAAERYKSAISASALSIDLLYGYGVRLENSRSRLEVEIAKGDYPEMAVTVGEVLDSIIALHGPVVYSTARGRELVERARSFEAGEGDAAAYMRAAQQVAAAIDQAKDAVTERAREAIIQAVDEIGQGKHPERSTEIVHTGLPNFIIGAAKGAQKMLRPEAMGEMATKFVIGAGGGAAVYYVGMPLVSFLLANKALLFDFSVAAGCELSWLPPFLNWVERRLALLEL